MLIDKVPTRERLEESREQAQKHKGMATPNYFG